MTMTTRCYDGLNKLMRPLKIFLQPEHIYYNTFAMHWYDKNQIC